MDTGFTVTKVLNRLEFHDAVLLLALIVGARVVSFVLRWLIRFIAEKGPGRWRLRTLKLMPIARLLVTFAAIAIAVPILIQPTLQNVVTLVTGVGLALAFALKDIASNLVAGLVTVVEGVYQPGDWIEVEGTYGEVHSIGLRAARVVTLDDTEVSIPHAKLWSTQVFNATSGNRHLLCVASFYVDPEHDAAALGRALEVMAAESPYLAPDGRITVVVVEKPWGTHYRVKAYVRESRDQVSFVTDLTVRGKAVLRQLGIKAARVPVAETNG